MRRSFQVSLLVSLFLLLPSTVSAGGVYVDDEVVTAAEAGPTVYKATDVIPEGEPTKVYLATSTGALTYPTQFDYTVREALATSGALTFTAYITCDAQTVMRPGSQNGANDLGTARAVFLKNGGEVSQMSLYSLRTCDGPDDIWEAVFELPSGDTAFAPGDVLNFQLLLWAPNGPVGSDAQNMHVLVGGAFPSGLTGAGLPGAAVAGPEVVHGNLTGEQALVEHDWASSRNTTFAYNWTAPAGNVSLQLEVAPQQGNVTVTVEGDGGEAFNRTFSEAGNVTETLNGGNWSIRVAYDDYVGTLRLSAEAAADEGDDGAPPEDDDPPGDGNTTAPPQGNGTSEGNESPGLGVVALLGAVAVAVVRRRG